MNTINLIVEKEIEREKGEKDCSVSTYSLVKKIKESTWINIEH